jgi:hypothetical protein
MVAKRFFTFTFVYATTAIRLNGIDVNKDTHAYRPTCDTREVAVNSFHEQID